MEHEITVKKELSMVMKILKIFIFCWPLALLLSAIFVNARMLVPSIAATVCSIFLLPQFEVEYEYIPKGSRIKIEKITGRNRRKSYICVEKENVKAVKKVEKKEQIDREKNFYDCSSGRLPLYQVIEKTGVGERCVLLTLSEKELCETGLDRNAN